MIRAMWAECVQKHTKTPMNWQDAADEFAQLIIQECLQQCERVRDDAAIQKKSSFLTQDGKMLYEGVYGGANNCGFAIQQYFGIEK